MLGSGLVDTPENVPDKFDPLVSAEIMSFEPTAKAPRTRSPAGTDPWLATFAEIDEPPIFVFETFESAGLGSSRPATAMRLMALAWTPAGMLIRTEALAIGSALKVSGEVSRCEKTNSRTVAFIEASEVIASGTVTLPVAACVADARHRRHRVGRIGVGGHEDDERFARRYRLGDRNRGRVLVCRVVGELSHQCGSPDREECPVLQPFCRKLDR